MTAEPNPTQPPHHHLTHWVHLSLSIGIYASAAVMVLGVILSLSMGQHAPAGPPPGWLRLIDDAIHGQPVALVQTGLVLLMLTPIVRVVVLGLGWLIEKEYRFATIALIVFALLIGSLILGSA